MKKTRRAVIAWTIATAGLQTVAPARAQESEHPPAQIAVSPESRDGTEPPTQTLRGWASGGARGTFGRAFTQGVEDGWFGRFEMEAFSAALGRGAGPLVGADIGGEIWLAGGDVGGGLPMGVWFGYRTPLIFSSIGFGFDLFVYDDVADDAGFGLFAPFGSAALGFDFDVLRLLVDGRVGYRWQWGAPDRAQATVGLSVIHVFDTSESRPPSAPTGG